MVASAKAIHMARRGEHYGFEADPILNFSRVMERMNEIRNGSSDGLKGWMESTETVYLIQGRAEFSCTKSLSVNGDEIKGEKIYLNVGTRPSAPPIPGLDRVEWMDSAKLLELKEVPEHLLIIG